MIRCRVECEAGKGLSVLVSDDAMSMTDIRKSNFHQPHHIQDLTLPH